jgi:hypothetical protein
MNHPQDAAISAKDFDLIFLEEPQRMAARRFESPAAVGAVANQQRLARGIAATEPKLLKSVGQISSDRFDQLSVVHVVLRGEMRGLNDFRPSAAVV